jgi:hypothetical protein
MDHSKDHGHYLMKSLKKVTCNLKSEKILIYFIIVLMIFVDIKAETKSGVLHLTIQKKEPSPPKQRKKISISNSD